MSDHYCCKRCHQRYEVCQCATEAAEPAQGVPRVRGPNVIHQALMQAAAEGKGEVWEDVAESDLPNWTGIGVTTRTVMLIGPSSDQHAGSIDTPEFSSLLSAYKSTSLKGAGLRAELIAHIDRHTREAVQAARKEALEEAALACEKFGRGYDNEINRSMGSLAQDLKDVADECAEQVRALATKKEQADG